MSNEIKQNNLDYTLFSWSKQAGIDPVVAERAEGVYVYDTDGNKIMLTKWKSLVMFFQEWQQM